MLKEAIRTSPPQTMLGQLQRGRGAGWLAACSAPDGGDVLLECLRFDPRWDSQVETRADYYGSLARELSIPAAIVATAPIDDADDARHLRLQVLASMGRRGDHEALHLLRDRLRDDADAGQIIHLLHAVPAGLTDLDRLIVSRFSEDGIVDLIAGSWKALPWDRWAEEHPSFARAVARYNAEPMPARPAPPDAGAPLEAFLAYDGLAPKAVVRRFARSVSDAEVAQLRQAAIGPPGPARYFALRALGARNDPCALDLAERTFAADISGRERATLFRYVRDLDGAHTLPLARHWLDCDDSRSGVAAEIMALHSEDGDIPHIRSALERAWRQQWMYAICSLIDALGRHPRAGPFDALRTIFADVDYSYARRRAASAMAKVDPDFGTMFAKECLWDCEPTIRSVGIETADTADVGALDRILRLANSESEDREVRAAAAARLRATT